MDLQLDYGDVLVEILLAKSSVLGDGVGVAECQLVALGGPGHEVQGGRHCC